MPTVATWFAPARDLTPWKRRAGDILRRQRGKVVRWGGRQRTRPSRSLRSCGRLWLAEGSCIRLLCVVDEFPQEALAIRGAACAYRLAGGSRRGSRPEVNVLDGAFAER